MSNLKISQLPLYTGNTSGSFLVMNNSGETTTYKVNSNTFLNGIATTSSNTFNGNQTITGSLQVTGSLNKFQGDVEITGSRSDVINRALAVSGSVYVARSLFVGTQYSPVGGISALGDSAFIQASGSNFSSLNASARPSGSSNASINILMFASGSNSVGISTTTGTFLKIISGSVAEPIQLLRTTNITGSVNISTVMTLAQQSPLPSGTTGSLAVSGSNLFFNNGTAWVQVI